MKKVRLLFEIYMNMGLSYVYYRSMFEIKRKFGLLKLKFPTSPPNINVIDLEKWRKSKSGFFFENKRTLSVPKQETEKLKKTFEQYQSGIFTFFNAQNIDIGTTYDWITNPITKYTYDISKHWTEIEDIAEYEGDIKYVWEKSRFSFLYTYIRYDYHFNEDCSGIVFSEIENWIDNNPINKGPNYKCSQEISLRVFNWIFALYYYSEAKVLTEKLFIKIINAIYYQIKHVYDNINFSRKTVRNNHAISESLMLYVGGLLFPFLPNALKWKNKGKEWFEKEVLYQIYNDGTHLLFSTNYHRAVLQLFTWALYLSSSNNDEFKPETYNKIKKALQFLYIIVDAKNGDVPNYGPNDGSLFYQLNSLEYRDYRPQLNALYFYFTGLNLYEDKYIQEEAKWMSKKRVVGEEILFNKEESIFSYPNGGYYLIRCNEDFTFIKCGSYKDRPSHADNLHIDIWYKGINILRDAGTYRYNTSQELIRYFNGTKSHNTVTIDEYDQMEKGPRFIWMNWSSSINAELSEQKNSYVFKGKIHAFKHIKKNIFHSRTIKKSKKKSEWVIEDYLDHDTNLPMKQWWNLSPEFESIFNISAFDENDDIIKPKVLEGWFSNHFGVKEKTKVIVYNSNTKKIKTTISKK